MIHVPVPTIYPIYQDINRISYWGGTCKGEACYALPIPKNRFLPFQFRRASSPNPVDLLKLICVSGTYAIDLLAILGESIEYKQNYLGGYDIITYYGNSNLLSDLDCGVYYLEIGVGTERWYGELVKVDARIDVDDCTCIAVNEFGDTLCIDGDLDEFVGTE